jgi:predicted O-methyltransferase YrrM
MELITRGIEYLKFILSSNTRHGTHSPFVYKLLDEVIYAKFPYYAFDQIENFRKEISGDKSTIPVIDLGAGSRIFKGKERSIDSIARHSVKSAKYGQLLFRLVQYFKPDQILELGTSLGITTLYLALAKPDAHVISIEGCPEISKKAGWLFKKAKADNIELINGNFEDKLPEIVQKSNVLDFIYIDGNHRKEPTLRYFSQVLEKCNSQSIIIFDDINWSKEMREAWKEIISNPKVTVSIDLFYMGIVMFRTEQPKEHFKIRF